LLSTIGVTDARRVNDLGNSKGSKTQRPVLRTKVTKEVLNILKDQIEKLQSIFPEAVSEGKVDFEKLRESLGDSVDERPERYTFTWAGKRNAIQILQMPTRATLIPAQAESINFDTSGHLFIEGDNLEVLKLLYKPYFGKVKMIYIDPPYNTGKDFIYRDNYADPLDSYLERTNQKDTNGNLLTSNPETSGRFHSDWLSMMWPRLFFAAQLLRNDGVIFVSIDDNEFYNLRRLMNMVFGEENFLAELVWDLRSGTSAGHFTRAHEYIVAYAKNKERLPNFPSLDSAPITGRTTIRPSRKNPISQIEFPAGTAFEGTDAMFSGVLGKEEPVRIVNGKMVFRNGTLLHPVKLESAWRMKDQMISWMKGEDTFDSKGQRVLSIYFNKQGVPWYKKERGFVNPKSVIRVGSTKDGTLEIEKIFGQRLMEFPKPSNLMRYLISIPLKADESALVLDFFAGSCTTAQAVLEANTEDGGNRRFIMVQLQEPTPEDSPARKVGFKTISDIGKERIRRVIARIKKDKREQNAEDLGFRVFKLVESNYKPWKGVEDKTPESYAADMEEQLDPLVDGWKKENVIYEVAIKEGYPLTCRIEREKTYKDNEIWRVTDPEKEQMFLICLDDKIRTSTIRSLGLTKDDLFVCRDIALDDTGAANLALQCNLKTI
jgi:adenine-specific DNA-methyltransferase